MVNDSRPSHGLYTTPSAECIYPNSRELGGSLVAMTVACQRNSHLVEFVVKPCFGSLQGVDSALCRSVPGDVEREIFEAFLLVISTPPLRLIPASLISCSSSPPRPYSGPPSHLENCESRPPLLPRQDPITNPINATKLAFASFQIRLHAYASPLCRKERHALASSS
jgi:hypothetical protein